MASVPTKQGLTILIVGAPERLGFLGQNSSSFFYSLSRCLVGYSKSFRQAGRMRALTPSVREPSKGKWLE